MGFKEIKKLVKRFGGWMEDDVARFPTPHQKDAFNRALAEAEKANNA